MGKLYERFDLLSSMQRMNEVAIRNQPNLVGSNCSTFPESVPYANNEVYAVRPTNEANKDPEAMGLLARRIIENLFAENPIILFRDFGLRNRNDFSRFFSSFKFQSHSYEGGAALRDKNKDNVNVASIEPPEVFIPPHNELVYMPDHPSTITFYCEKPADEGGEIPVNDIRQITNNIPIEMQKEISDRGLRYIRRYTRENTPFSIGWQQSFGTELKIEVENRLNRQGINFKWEEKDVLYTWHLHPPFTEIDGKKLWFNQLTTCHRSYWTLAPTHRNLGANDENVHMDTAYGDGEPFGQEFIDTLHGYIWQSVKLIKLQAGDVLLLNNKLIQHGRLPYRGERIHYTALGSS